MLAGPSLNVLVSPGLDQTSINPAIRGTDGTVSCQAKILCMQESMYGARFSTEIYTRGCHLVPTPARLKRSCMRMTKGIPLVCPLPLTVPPVKSVQTLKATEMLKGMQEEDEQGHPKMIALVKHFTAYSQESGRGYDEFNISQYNLFDSYLRQFEMAFKEGGASGAMCSYNGVNGHGARFSAENSTR
jgi:hypothetical protein